MEEITLDFTRQPRYAVVGKEKTRTRKSYPNEAAYQKRFNWWIAQGYGEEPAAFAASWRLGLPERTRRLEPGEEIAIQNAIRIGKRRPDAIAYRMRKFGDSREKAIKELDKDLRIKDRQAKGLTTLALSDKAIDSNIFKDIS